MPSSAASPETSRLVLLIYRDGVAVPYSVDRLWGHKAIPGPAWRLTKTDGSTYDVANTEHGLVCECPDFANRRDGKDPEGCKHIRELVNRGLLRGRA